MSSAGLAEMKQASLGRWIVREVYDRPKRPWLPNPNTVEDDETARDFECSNKVVEDVLDKTMLRKKRGSYYFYDAKSRAWMARYAEVHGLAAAARAAEKKFGHPVTKSSIQSIRNSFRRKLAMNPTKEPDEIEEFPQQQRGRPLLIGPDLDSRVIKYLRTIRESGGVVNRKIVQGCARGIILEHRPSLLRENGGPLDLSSSGNGRSWSNSLLERARMVKRKSTKAAKKLPADFDDQKERFLSRIGAAIRTHNIPGELVINIDETPLRIVPVDKWTLEEEGAAQVPLTGQEDKREVTGLLGCTLSGTLLPPQVLYEGKTERCHPRHQFPDGWDIWHSETHWSNEATVQRYVGKILSPWIEKCKLELNLPAKQRALVILDVYKAHSTPAVHRVMEEHDIEAIFVPNNWTAELQPLDVSVNAQFKTELKEQFTKWYVDRVCEAIKANPGDMRAAVDAVKPDMRLSTMKPLHASWLVNSFTAMKKNGDLIQSGWRRTGIEDAFRSAASTVSTVSTAPESDKPSDVQWSNKASLSGRVFDITGPLRIPSSNEAHRMAFSEEFLCRDLCQSRLGGREGSSACTLIAVLSSQRILRGILQLPGSKGCAFEEESIKIFLDCISHGNDLYDRKVKAGFLSVFMALAVCHDVPLAVKKELFIVRERGWKNLVDELTSAAKKSENQVAVGILVSTPYSVVIASNAAGSLFILDSHSHGPSRGALLGSSTSSATATSMALHLSRFLARHYALANVITLPNGIKVPREFHFALMEIV